MKEMVRLQGITKKFGNNVIIPSLDLTIYDGEFITLLGPSGCGKTTLLRMIAGLEEISEGELWIGDELCIWTTKTSLPCRPINVM